MPKPKSPFIYYLRFEWSNVLPFNGLFNLFVFTFNQNLGGIRTLVLILIRNYVTIIALQQRPRITYLVRNRLCWDKTFQEVFEVILGWILMTLRFLFKPSSFQSSLLPLRIQPLSLSFSLRRFLSLSYTRGVFANKRSATVRLTTRRQGILGSPDGYRLTVCSLPIVPIELSRAVKSNKSKMVCFIKCFRNLFSYVPQRYGKCLSYLLMLPCLSSPSD